MIFDPLYLVFAIPGILLALGAQLYLRWAYGKNSQTATGRDLTGNEVAQLLNEREGFGVRLESVPGELTDHYNPVEESVALSVDNATNKSVANIAVVAHEFGHVQQKRDGMALFRLRTAIVPLVQFGSSVGYILMILGFILSIGGMINIGLILFSSTAFFALITLPIEIDASRRGMALIKKYDLIAPGKLGGAKNVLTAAAMTYLAGLVQQLMILLYFFIRSRD